MASSGVMHLNVPIFAGQGTAAANNPQTRQQAIRDASSPSGSLLLSACHEAFHTELSSLYPTEFDLLGINLNDFESRDIVLLVPSPQYLHNPVISGPTLFLIQALRYIAFIETSGSTQQSLTPFSDALKRNMDAGVGVLGFSSGILPACVVSTSLNALSFISRAVEAYRLSIWIGVRSQIYRQAVLNHIPSYSYHPWSLVFLGTDRKVLEASLESFRERHEPTHEPTPLYVTAIMDDTCITISGRPDALADFSESLAVSSVVHKTTLDTLYHAPIHLQGAREQVLADVSRRGIVFPDFGDVKVPLRSTFTGEALTKETTAGTLVELIVDMLLTQPVNWDLVVMEVVKAVPEDIPVRLVNVGPGMGLSRSLERALPRTQVGTMDISTSIAEHSPQTMGIKQEPIAIVGMAVNMPGAPSNTMLWDVLEKGINTISEIPEHRFKVSDYTDAKNPNRQLKAHTGNFIEDVDGFDNAFFKISPREAKSMDPQQRILLHTAYEALEDSGYVPDATPSFRADMFGCYIGVATHDYVQNLRNEIDVYYSTGTLKAFLSGRISYAMKLSGPSIVVDTACSSSSVAIYQGARALMNGDCNAAMVGGVNVISSPDMFLGLDRGHFLSPTGQCKAFDASADGYSRSEGCGIFILKRLSDAIAENDNIYGVIRGIEVNQSGLAHSITHPHAPTQATLFKRLLTNSGVDASRINVVEAHGTGTQAGDPNELESIRSIFAASRGSENPLHITSVKANIGHLEAASGAAGLAKLLLMLRHRTIPQQISLVNLNPRIAPLELDKTIINTRNVSWIPSHVDMTRMALLNNFGAAGSNTALLLEEHPPMYLPSCQVPVVFGISAKDETSLEVLRSKHIHWLRSPESADIRLVDIAYTATARRQIYNYRICVSASSRDELVEKLEQAPVSHRDEKRDNIVFVFSGQGGQYLGMGRSLYETSPLFKHHIDECHHILTSEGFPGVIPIITRNSAQGSGLETLHEFEAYQAAIFSLEYALAKLWISWGLTPKAVVGHSLGEYAALVFAGVLDLKGALTIVAHRVRFMVQKCAVGSTGMIAVNAGPTTIEEALASSDDFADLRISCYNGPSDCVLSGSLQHLTAFKGFLDSTVRCKNVLLSVPFGFHSIAMSPLLDDLTAVVKHITLHPPTIPIVSNLHGQVVSPGDESCFGADYFARHCAEPVMFEKGIHSLLSRSDLGKVDAWIEIGPHTTTLPMLKSIAGLTPSALLLGSLRRQQESWCTLTSSLSQLFVANVDLHWRKVFAHIPAVSCVSLPSYAFAKKKYWVGFEEDSALTADARKPKVSVSNLITDYSMLHAWAQRPSKENGSQAVFHTPISRLASSIVGHSVGGMPLCPASVYLEQVLAGVDLAERHLGFAADDSHIVLGSIQFQKPLVYDEAVARTVVTVITLNGDSGTFTVSSAVDSSQPESLHVRGEYHRRSNSKTTTKFSRSVPLLTRNMDRVTASTAGQEVFSTRTAYEVIFPRVVDYAKEYHTMKSLVVDSNGMEGCALVQLPSDYERGKYVVHPVFMDTMLHVAGFVANMTGGIDDAYICSEVGSVRVIPRLVDNDASYHVYCNNAWLPEEGVIIAEAWAIQTANPRQIVAHLKGMHFRRVRLASLKKGLAHATGKPIIPALTKKDLSTPVLSSMIPPLGHRLQPNSASVSDVQADVLKIISETCDISSSALNIGTELDALGVDSLMSIEILGKLQTMYSRIELDSHLLASTRTVSDIIREVNLALSSSSETSPPTTRTVSRASSPRTLVSEHRLPQLVPSAEPDIHHIIASVLDIKVDHIKEDVSFESLGLDSLTSIEALHALKSEFNIDLPGDFFITYQTPREAQSHLSVCLLSRAKNVEERAMKIVSPSPAPADKLLARLGLNTLPALLQRCSDPCKAPLYLIHDGSGMVNYYERLSPLNRPIWGIHNAHFLSAKPWDDIPQMARSYADLIAAATSGPVLLGGWSFGGVVAYEISLQLAKRGIKVQGIVLVDSPNPINHVPLSDALIESVLNLDSRSSSSEVGKLVQAQFRMNARLLGDYDPHATGGSCPPLVLLRSSEGYNPPGVADVPVWLADRSDPSTGSAGWSSLVTLPVKVLDIPGHHFQPFHATNIGSVSLAMAEGCTYLEKL